MSLVIAIARGRDGIIVSDGAESELRADGGFNRSRDDCPKFRDVGANLVLAAVGSAWLIEQLYDVVERFLHCARCTVLDDLAGFLSANLADWNRLANERSLRDNPNANANQAIDTSVLVLGYDTIRERARIVGWQASSHFQATELEGVAVGIQTNLDLSRPINAARAGATPQIIAQRIEAAIKRVSRADSRVGGRVYSCIVDPDYRSPARGGGR